jgi:hypothetical protein
MNFVGFGANMLSAIAIGIVMATLIEMPVLKLRDRLFPSTLKSRIGKDSVPVIKENSLQTEAACGVAARIA